jgi:hypothetical protein
MFHSFQEGYFPRQSHEIPETVKHPPARFAADLPDAQAHHV